jgi:hypothetical protein
MAKLKNYKKEKYFEEKSRNNIINYSLREVEDGKVKVKKSLRS